MTTSHHHPLWDKIAAAFILALHIGACTIISKYGEHAPISKCEVKIKEEENLPAQTLDLLKAREKCNIVVNVGNDKIVSLSSRYGAIERAYNEWAPRYFPPITE